MPIKQVTCCICNEVVNKAQTLSVGEGKRACRSHSETATQSQAEQQKLKDEANKRAEALEKARNAWRNKSDQSDEVVLQPKCFVCRKPGLRQDEYFFEMLKCGERFELVHGRPHNVLDPQEMTKMYEPLAGKRCLWIIPFDPNLKLHYNAKQAAQILGFAAICAACCESQNIELSSPTKDLNFDQLMTISAVYESCVKPVIKEMVSQEAKDAASS